MFISPESCKEKAVIIRNFLKEKYNIDLSQGHGLEIVSKIFGFKDWNTASATLKPKVKQNFSPVKIETVGDMKKALAQFDDSAIVDACYNFKIKEFEIDPLADPEDEIYQEFSLTIEEFMEDIASFKLELANESMSITSPYSYSQKEDCGFFKIQEPDEL